MNSDEKKDLAHVVAAVRQALADRLPQLASTAAKGLVPLSIALGLAPVVKSPEDIFFYLAGLAPNFIGDMLLDMRSGKRELDVDALAEAIAERLDDPGVQHLAEELQIIATIAQTLQDHGQQLRDLTQTLERELKMANWDIPPAVQVVINSSYVAQADRGGTAIVVGPGGALNYYTTPSNVPRKRFLHVVVGRAEGLQDERDAVRDAIRRLPLPGDLELALTSSQSTSPLEVEALMRRRCDLYVGFLGGQYGPPVIDGKSITHLEIETLLSLEQKKPLLLYRQELPEDQIDEPQQALIAQLTQAKHDRFYIRPFSVLDGLAALGDQAQKDINALLEGTFEIAMPRPQPRSRPTSGRRGLLASLGRSPGTVTGLYHALVNRDPPAPIDYVRTVSTSEYQVQRAVRAVQKELRSLGMSDYQNTFITAEEFDTEKDVVEFKDAFRELLAHARLNGDAVAIGIAGGRTVMGALLTMVAQMEAPADSAFYQLSVPDDIEQDGRFPQFGNQSPERQATVLRPTESLGDHCALVEIPFSRFYDEIEKEEGAAP